MPAGEKLDYPPDNVSTNRHIACIRLGAAAHFKGRKNIHTSPMRDSNLQHSKINDSSDFATRVTRTEKQGIHLVHFFTEI